MHTKIDNEMPTYQNYLVTGGTGFIGSALCETLLAQGHHVTILSRAPRPVRTMSGSNVKYVMRISDLSPTEVFHVVIGLAGEPIVGPRWTSKRKALLHASRRDLTVELVQWMQHAQYKPRLFISASAIGYYGVQNENDITTLNEDAPPQNIFMSDICQEWEQAALAAKDAGVHVAILRLGVVLGHLSKGKGALPKMILPLKLGMEGRIGSGKQVVSWVHLDDVLGAIDFLQNMPVDQVDGCYNVCAPAPCSQATFMKEAAQLQKSFILLPLATPAWFLRLVLGEQASLLVQGQRVIPKRLMDLGFQFKWPSLNTALEDCLKH